MKDKVNKVLNKDVKEINKVFISLFSVGILLVAVFVGVNITKNSYALFSDSVTGEKTLEVTVDLCSMNKPNAPVLDSNMIAVYYDEEAEVWKKADENNSSGEYMWYDYCDKMWANSVTVSSTNRETYLNASPGTEIDMDDVLTMQVWIPRYKYKVFNYNSNGTTYVDPESIEIVFEEGTSSTGEIECTDNIQGEDGNGTSEICKLKSTNSNCTDSTCNNKYYTHPAFTFGEEELTGFWVGKFEVSTQTTSTCYTSESATNCNKTGLNLIVKPGVKSYRYTQIGTFQANIMAMNDTSNIYGFSTNDDIHMMKNMEWGAVAYLSHSEHGLCTDTTCSEIGINNNSGFLTGCGAASGSTSSTSCNSYNTELGKNASTTGNIYGVYDMSGGSFEYLMGNSVGPNGTTMISGFSSSYNSGYSGVTNTNATFPSYSGKYSYPNVKYYDKYSFGTDGKQALKSKLGDAIREIMTGTALSWYGNYGYVVDSAYSWYRRGGNYVGGDGIGLFSSSSGNGATNNARTTRLTIANINNN